MDGLNLLEEAESAGLSVSQEGGLLRVEGPKRLASTAKRLLANKLSILTAMRQRNAPVCSCRLCGSLGWWFDEREGQWRCDSCEPLPAGWNIWDVPWRLVRY